MLIADQLGAGSRPLVEVVSAAAEGAQGRIAVQVREKALEREALALLLRELRDCLPPQSLLMVNDRPDLAAALGIGLHLPAASPLPRGRSFMIVGRSVHDRAEAAAALADRVDYAVAGTIFATASHPGRAGAGLGHLRGLSVSLAPIPVYAIGGIDAGNAAACVAAGAWGAAVRGAILGADDPAAAARELAARLRA